MLRNDVRSYAPDLPLHTLLQTSHQLNQKQGSSTAVLQRLVCWQSTSDRGCSQLSSRLLRC